MMYLQRFQHLWHELGIVAKLKVAIGYFQIVLAMPEVYAVPLPDEYFRWVRVFEFISFEWFSILAPVECVGDYSSWLKMKALTPLVMLLLIVAIGAGGRAVVSASAPHAAAAVRHSRDQETPNQAAETPTAMERRRERFFATLTAELLQGLPFVLMTLFTLVPPVGGRILSVFR